MGLSPVCRSQLTEAQKHVFGEIITDMQNPSPNEPSPSGRCWIRKDNCRRDDTTVHYPIRLSGRLDGSYRNPYAEQHAYHFSELLEPIGLNVVLLKGDMTKSEHEGSSWGI